MKKIPRLLLALAATGLCNTTVQAAPPVNAGHLYFTGDVGAISCTAGAVADNGDLTMDMGSTVFDDIGTIDSPILLNASQLNISVVCPGGAQGMDAVHMTFLPDTGGTGLDPTEPRLLANTGSATGVGVAIVKQDDTLLNFSTQESLVARVTEVSGAGRAELNLRAVSIRNGATTTVGSLRASAPFLLTYE